MDEPKLKKTTIILIVAVALGYDGVQFLINFLHLVPIVGNVIATVATALISVFAWLTFYVWFKTHGIHFSTAKRGLVMGGVLFVEIPPIINDFPGWTAAVVIIILTNQATEIIQSIPGASNLSKIPGLEKVLGIKNTAGGAAGATTTTSTAAGAGAGAGTTKHFSKINPSVNSAGSSPKASKVVDSIRRVV